MSTSKRSASYPQYFETILQAAYSGDDDFVIEHPKPNSLRLQFNGYRAALRLEGKSEVADELSFHVTDTAVVIKRKDQTIDALAAAKALAKYNEQTLREVNTAISASAEKDLDDVFTRLMKIPPTPGLI